MDNAEDIEGASAELTGDHRPTAASPATSCDQRANQGTASMAPMIIVSAEGTNRCDAIPYDDLAAACGQWDTSRLLGSGGSATVFRADVPKLGPVAVKRFTANCKDAGREWARELEALCSCRHPSILEIVGYSCEGPENLIVMPLMEGGTLAGAIPRMSWSARGAVLGQIVRAVTFLHGKKIVHRDVKSTNILLDRSLRLARLADFGLAKEQVHVATHGTTGIVRGSPGYMAPELMMRAANEKTDAYALGVVFLEALTGLPAWDGAEGGMALTDRAVEDGVLLGSLLDKSAEWPALDSEVVSDQAVAMTLFDPGQRRTPISTERDNAYVKHLERAEAASSTTRGAGGPGPAVVGSRAA